MPLFLFFIFLNLFYLFIYFWVCWVFISVQGLSLVVASRGHSSSRCAGLSLSRPLLLRSTGSRRAGSVIVAQGPFVPWHAGSSQTRARTRVPCIGRQILNHCTTREAHLLPLLNSFSLLESWWLFPPLSHLCCSSSPFQLIPGILESP